jgi:xylan 1,4-beta-xylosidase
MYSSYTAAAFARKHELADKHGVNFAGALTWAFEFEDQPYFAGFRELASNGIDLPVLNVFRMFSRMGGQRLDVASDGAAPLDQMLREGVRAGPDVSALASLEQNRLCVLAWHYHDDDVPGAAAAVRLELDGLPARKSQARLEHYRIDEDHSNAYALWKRWGLSAPPTAEQYAQLEHAGRLAALGRPETVSIDAGKLAVHFELPRQAVSLLVLEWSQK